MCSKVLTGNCHRRCIEMFAAEFCHNNQQSCPVVNLLPMHALVIIKCDEDCRNRAVDTFS